VQGDDGPEHDPPEFVASSPVQDQAAELAAPADTGTPQYPCPICGRIFQRSQERNRHVRSFLPHWIYCPFPHSSCPFRCNRRGNLANHWREEHAGSGHVPQKQHYQIYDPDELVTAVVSGQMFMEQAENNALSAVGMRAQELGKEGTWGGDFWGRRRRPHPVGH